MTLSAAILMCLAAQGAPGVAPATSAAIVQTERQGCRLAINVNGLNRKVAQPTSIAQAIEIGRSYVSQGYSVDLGLGQINSTRMKALGLTWKTVFDRWANSAATGSILAGDYQKVSVELHVQRAVRVALLKLGIWSRSRRILSGCVGRRIGTAGVPEDIQPVSLRNTAISLTETGKSAQFAALVAEWTSATCQRQATRPPSRNKLATAAYGPEEKPNEPRIIWRLDTSTTPTIHCSLGRNADPTAKGWQFPDDVYLEACCVAGVS